MLYSSPPALAASAHSESCGVSRDRWPELEALGLLAGAPDTQRSFCWAAAAVNVLRNLAAEARNHGELASASCLSGLIASLEALMVGLVYTPWGTKSDLSAISVNFKSQVIYNQPQAQAHPNAHWVLTVLK